MTHDERTYLEDKLMTFATSRLTKADQQAAIMAWTGLLVIDRLDAIKDRLSNIEDTLNKGGGA
ncbi:MAG: hypothetical protein OXE57_14820 [Alphaproteobacteria bacterium]|nr:hypothetical protein [Alphaproteobacteria bacterium]